MHSGATRQQTLLIAHGKPVRTHNLLQLGKIIEEEAAARLPGDVKRCLRRLNPPLYRCTIPRCGK